MRNSIVGSVVCLASSGALAIAGCASQDDAVGVAEQDSTIPGGWSLPSAVHTVAQAQFVAYDDAPPWDGGAHCSGTFFPGTRALKDYLEAHYAGISSIGGYACRQNTADASRTSIHGTGRALDVMIPTIGGDADNTTGDEIGNWLITHAEFIGIQLVIWDHRVWQASLSGEKLQPYGGPIPHVDHLHVELTKAAGEREETAFFHHPRITRGDIDGDGRADLVTANSNGDAYVYAGNASGAFSGATASFAGTLDSALFDRTGHVLVGVADVTGDGRSDLVSVSSDGSAFVWPGRADRTFGSAVASFAGTMVLASATRAGHDPAAVADVDGDGFADLITVNTNGNVYVYRGSAAGTFATGSVNFAGTFKTALRDGVGHWVVGAADVNGDGRADLVTVHSSGNAYVYPGRADASFGSGIASFAGTMQAAVLDGQAGHVPVGVADVDGDGRADLVTVHSNGNAYVYPGTASGAFSGATASFSGTLAMGQFAAAGHQVVGVLDVTGDGRADLVTLFNGSAYVYPGTASGAFGGSTASFAGTMDSSFRDGTGHELIEMGPVARRRACTATGCRAP
jgi:hypothetical protein